VIMCRFQKSQKRRRNGVEAVGTAAVRNDLRTHCGDGKRKRKLQGFPTNLLANGNTWEEYLGPRGTGICLRHMATLKYTIPGHNCNWSEHITFMQCEVRRKKLSFLYYEVGYTDIDVRGHVQIADPRPHGHTFEFSVSTSFPTSKSI
jgi:hypothetical protein